MSLKKQHLYRFEEFVLDTKERQLWRENKTVALQPKAIETLCLLVENHGKLLSKDELMDQLWADTFVEERNLAQNVFILRKALGEDKKGTKFIETVPKRGYRFVANVQATETREDLFEISLSEKTTIKAQGDVSSDKLAEAVRTTAESLAVDRPQTQEINQIGPKSKPGFFSKISTTVILTFGIFSLLAVGMTFWFWKNPDFANQNSNSKPGFTPGLLKFERMTDSGKAFFPAISRDNKYVAYEKADDGKYWIVLQHLETKSETVIAESVGYEMRSLQFSADGNHIFYAIRGPEMVESTVYKIPVLGGTKRQVLTNVRHLFSISTDGSQIAFFRYDPKKAETHLMTAKIDGTNEKIITTRKTPKFFRVWGTLPVWSPDDKKVVAPAMTELSGDKKGEKRTYFLEVDVATGEEKIIKSPDWALALQAFWRRDGSGLIVSAQEKSNQPLQPLGILTIRAEMQPN